MKAMAPRGTPLADSFRKGAAVAAIAVLIGLALGLAQYGLHRVMTADDAREIKAVIETAYELRGVACTEDHRDEAANLKAALASYWSSMPRNAAELARRRARARDFSLPDSWADQTPLESVQAAIDECLDDPNGRLRLPKSFGISRVKYRRVVISDESAEVESSIDHWSKLAFSDGEAQLIDSTGRYLFQLQKAEGTWKLVREERLDHRLAP